MTDIFKSLSVMLFIIACVLASEAGGELAMQATIFVQLAIPAVVLTELAAGMEDQR
jgi:hypothetical protein